jgi:flagellar basal body-associated protein FliL
MFGFLGFIVFIVLCLVLLVVGGVVAVWWRVKRALFGSRQSKQQTYTRAQDSSAPQSRPKKKLIEADEGEYVDFEEIKE